MDRGWLPFLGSGSAVLVQERLGSGRNHVNECDSGVANKSDPVAHVSRSKSSTLMASRRNVSAARSAAPAAGDSKIDWKGMETNISKRAEWLNDLVQDNRRWMPDGLPLFRMDHEAAQG